MDANWDGNYIQRIEILTGHVNSVPYGSKCEAERALSWEVELVREAPNHHRQLLLEGRGLGLERR